MEQLASWCLPADVFNCTIALTERYCSITESAPLLDEDEGERPRRTGHGSGRYLLYVDFGIVNIKYGGRWRRYWSNSHVYSKEKRRICLHKYNYKEHKTMTS